MTELLWPATHRLWLVQHALDLLTFGRRTPQPDGGAAWLDEHGRADGAAPTYTWITCRMLHVYCAGALLGVPGSAPIAQRVLTGLTGRLHDDEHGGWHHAVQQDGTPASGKDCYDHAFVLLAASSARQANLAGAADLLERAQRTFLRHFWDEGAGMCVDRWNTEFTECESYRGINANMHAVEAMLSVAGVTGDRAWIERAVQVCRFVVSSAQAHHWRLPEHYDESWRPMLEHNRDRSDDQFKPFGATVGHGLEWARLLLHAEAAQSGEQDGWLFSAATALFERAIGDGWGVDGQPGFVYTTDWDGRPIVRERMHWVVAEAINAAAALYQRSRDERYAALYRTYWDYADEHFIDHELGSWRHQLTSDHQAGDSVWAGKPDTYHAFQAALGPLLPLYPMLTTAIFEGRLA
ncbi:AGE family epimerase/isomerase [Kineococcus glutinatus]|uniref:AGE family epimerase/isomerase n=1 Tax=Kineococcus glutinatus TaxID=1070872 RepID=A0ABP9H9W0_9ACTN